MNKIIGIDLGTTYSCIAFESNIIVNDMGERITPSYIYIDKDKIIVGNTAKEQDICIYGVKRLLGKKFSEIDVNEYTFPITRGDNDEIIIYGYSPEKISSFVLSYLRKCAENYFGHQIKKVIITIPAYFNHLQRKATMLAAELAELEVVQLINEPTAGALANGSYKEGKIIVFDLGGGTLDVTLLEVNDGLFEIKGTSGDMKLGGEDIDLILMKFCEEEFGVKKNSGLKKTCETAKKQLSSLMTTLMVVEGKEIELSRIKFEELIEEFATKCLTPVKEVLSFTSVQKEEIKDIVLLGGSTRIPLIRDVIKDFFEKEINILNNPDEAVAIGASIQANSLKNEITLLDVVSLSLGVETADGKMVPIITRGSIKPIKKEKIFKPYSLNQSKVEIKIYEGEQILSKDNVYLGKVMIEQLNNNSQIKVVFNINENGIIEISCIDTVSKKTKQLVIEK